MYFLILLFSVPTFASTIPHPSPIPSRSLHGVPWVTTPQDIQARNAQFGQKIMQDFALLNVQRGLTSAQRATLAAELSPIATLMLSGDLKAALDILPTVPVDGVLITQALIDAFTTKLRAFLPAPSPSPSAS